MSNRICFVELPASATAPAKAFYATEAQVRKAGGVITKAAFAFPGGRRFHFRDPAGNELAAMQAG